MAQSKGSVFINMQAIIAALLVPGLVTEAARERRQHTIVFSLVPETNYFIHNLSKSLAHIRQSMVFSPYSLHSALTQTSLFARGRTAEEMQQSLGLKNAWRYGLPNLYNQLNIMIRDEYFASGVLCLDPTFLAVCSFYYNNIHLSSIREPYPIQTVAMTLPNGACISPEAVNSYLLSKTDDNIDIRLPPGTMPRGTILLINTMVIRAEWQDMFDEKKTYRHYFLSLDANTSSMVDIMTDVRTVGWKRDNKLKVDVVEVPLKGRELGFYMILPHDDRGLLDMETRLLRSDRTVSSLSGSLSPTSVRLGIPKFRLHMQLNLKKNLQDLGMAVAFSPDTADFTQLSLADKLYLSDVIHVTAITINEQGISVSPATSPLKSSSTSKTVLPSHNFIADHPFSFFIQHNYLGRVLISGRYTGL